MLEEIRKTLHLADQSFPYVLFPHSMSGLEALRWGQKYPCEVQAEGIPLDNPMYFFISEGSDVDTPNWRDILTNYVITSSSAPLEFSFSN